MEAPKEYTGEERRRCDEHFKMLNDMYRLVMDSNTKINEVHQRQVEFTVPKVERLEREVFGKEGLCLRVSELETDVVKTPKIVWKTISILVFLFTCLVAVLEFWRTKIH